MLETFCLNCFIINCVDCMSIRAINICCARVIWSRYSALVIFFYMRLEKHVCNAMCRGRL
jgi:hypothetical protein